MGVSPFLAWGDFHARSRFARSTIPEEKWGTTRNLLMNRKYKQWLYYSTLNVCTCITMPSCYNENNTMRLAQFKSDQILVGFALIHTPNSGPFGTYDSAGDPSVI